MRISIGLDYNRMAKYEYKDSYPESLKQYMSESATHCLDGWLSQNNLPSWAFYSFLEKYEELFDAYCVAKSGNKASLLTEIHVGCSDRYYNANAADKLFGRKFCTRYAKIRNWDKKDKPADQAKLVLEQLANHVIEFEVADVMLSSIERMVKVIASTEHEERIAELEKQLLTLLDSDSANHYEPQDAIGDTGEAAPASKGK